MGEKLTIEKKIYTEGVNCQGFGRIFKALTTDSSIPIQSKAIYAYLASFAGGSNSAFPSIKKIMEDLGFSHSSYLYKYLNILLDNGYIKVRKIRNISNNYVRNEYILTSKREDIPVTKSKTDGKTDKISIDGFASMGYGTVPKKVMVDRNLHIQSKALYAYFCSYSGAGNSCIPSQKLICKQLSLTRNTLVKYIKELEEANYIEVIKNQSETGQTLTTQYNLVEKPVLSVTEKHKNNVLNECTASTVSEEGGVKFEPTVSKKGGVKFEPTVSGKRGVKFGPIVFGSTVFEPTNNNSINNNSIKSNRNNTNKSSSYNTPNIYPQLKNQMMKLYKNEFNLPDDIYIIKNVYKITYLEFYLVNTNRLIELSPVFDTGKYCTAELGANRALNIAQALSILYVEEKINDEDLEDIRGIYQNTRESKISNYKRYLMTVIRKNRQEKQQNVSNEKLRNEKIEAMEEKIALKND